MEDKKFRRRTAIATKRFLNEDFPRLPVSADNSKQYCYGYKSYLRTAKKKKS
jgi:hypothetical protein